MFEERLTYKDKFGNWVTNILQVPQKTEASWWEQIINDSGKINDIADAGKARTAFAVNGNHSNDAVIVKRFHQWGAKNNIGTSTIHDAFFTNITDMLKGRDALRGIYSDILEKNVVLDTLNEMKARGLPNQLYIQYLEEAIDKGLIPIVGKSKIGGKLVTDSDILKKEDILGITSKDFKQDRYWYGVG
jgi:DNA-directed RNA polymerase